jgi:hypothetical protein
MTPAMMISADAHPPRSRPPLLRSQRGRQSGRRRDDPPSHVVTFTPAAASSRTRSRLGVKPGDRVATSPEPPPHLEAIRRP